MKLIIIFSLITTSLIAAVISEIKEITLTEDIQKNVRLESGSKLFLNQLVFRESGSEEKESNLDIKLNCKALRKNSSLNCKVAHLEKTFIKN